MAHSHSSPSPTVERGAIPSVFQPTSSEGPVVWRPLSESFNIVKTNRAPGGGFTVYQIVYKVWTESPERGPVIQECEVWKRYSDFQHLSKQLEVIHSQSRQDTAFPSIVKAKYFERFKDSVIEERKKSAEALLYFATYYQHLAESQPLRQFLSGAKVVGRLSANPGMMSSNSPTSGSFSIPSYPPMADFDLPSNHNPDVQGEEQLAAGSSLNTHQVSGQSGESITERTDHTDKDNRKSDANKGVQADTSSSQQEPAGGEGNIDQLTVPEAGGTTSLSSGGNSATGSWEELRNVNGVHHSSSHVSLDRTELDPSVQELDKNGLEVEVGSVHVTEWNLAHSLKLRDTEVRPGGLIKEEESESESDDPDQKPSNGESPSDSSSSKLSSPTPTGIAIVGSPRSSLGKGGMGGEGMEWWKEAMAETQNVTEDIDSLVEQLETDGTGKREGPSVKKTSTASADGVVSLERSSQAGGGGEREAGDGGRDRNKALGRASGYPSTDSINSLERKSSRPSSRSPSPGRRRGSPSIGEKGAYVVQAGRLIKQALSYERKAEYQEAFDLFKAGVDVLLNGVQTDQSKQRREVVRRKTAEYLKHAEELYQKHLAEEQEQVERLEQLPPPRRTKPHLLPDFKVIGIIGKVILVESRHTGQKYIFKVLYKSLHAMAAVGKGQSKATTNRTPKLCPHMVRLLHHYETSTHRIFLLLEYVDGGRLIDFVSGKRDQWKKLHEAVTNPPPSSSLIISDAQKEKESVKEASPVARESEKETTNSQGKEDEKQEEEDLEMERMLSELSSIVPPKSLPITDSLTSQEGLETESERESDENSEPTNSIDRLAVLRKRLEASAEPEDSATRLDETAGAPDDDDSNATINILPPTPTVPSKPVGFEGHILSEKDRTPSKDSLTVEDALIPRRSLANELESAVTRKAVSESVAVPRNVAEESRVGGSPGNGSSGQGSPCFSPGALRNTSDADTKADDWILRLEDKVRLWAAQIIVALDHIHNCGIVCRDLNPNNILISRSKSALLTYFGSWDFVEPQINHELARRLYIAPELCGLCEVHPSADWWSLGAILFEILTGKTLASCHPDGVHSHLTLRVPVALSPEAHSLLSQLLQVNPNERLGAGLAGVEELKAHSFFSNVNWNSV